MIAHGTKVELFRLTADFFTHRTKTERTGVSVGFMDFGEEVMRRVLQDVSAATAILGFAWMITLWGSVLGAA
jgi:hypothetical protein